MDPPNTLCAKCYNSLKTKYIECHICRAKYHLLCAMIDEKICEIFKSNKNIVFNCNDCINVSSDLLSHISSLSNEIRELKKPVVETTTIIEDVKELKLGFKELVKNLERQNNQQKLHLPKNANRNVIANQRTLANVVVGDTHCDDACSSVTSFSAAVSQVQSNTYDDTDNGESGFTTVRSRKRKNRVIVVGKNDSNDLAVVAKKKYLHISSFKPTVTADHVIDFIEKNTEIGKQHLECTRLVKKDTDISTLKHVNFKLGVSQCFYNDIVKSSLWPTDIRIRPFVFFPKKLADLQTAS